jgi:hypothetical protein
MGDIADFILDYMMDDEIDEETGEFRPGPFTPRPRLIQCGPGPCPRCGGPTHKLIGKFGIFYGCDSYPKCKGSRRYYENS